MVNKYARAMSLLKQWLSQRKTGRLIIHFSQGGVTRIEKFECDEEE
jgi:hypothetical protein